MLARFIPNLPAQGARVHVVGALLNQQSAFDAYAPQMHADPHKAPPKAPVLYLKPANTWARTGAVLELPGGSSALLMGATLGAVIGRRATRLSLAQASEVVAAYTLAMDVSLPQPSLYRPPLKYNCRDNFCPMGPHLVPAELVPLLSDIELHTDIDGVRVHTTSFKQLVRSLPTLLADITEFMTLDVGDVLLLGIAHDAPHARAGQSVHCHAAQSSTGQPLAAFGRLDMRVVAEGQMS